MIEKSLLSRGWKDCTSDLSLARPVGSNQPTWEVFDGSIYAWQFSASQMNELQAGFHINHDYAPITKVYPHIHWTPSDAQAGVVRWGFEYVAAKGHNQSSGGTFGATTTVYVEQLAPETAFRHMIAEVSNQDAFSTNLEPDSIVYIRVFRDAAHGNDTYLAPVFGLYLDLHFESDTDVTTNKSFPFDAA